MNPRTLGLLLAVGLLAGADDPKDKDDDKARPLEGTWVVQEARRDGVVSENQADDILTFKDGELTIRPDEEGAAEELADYTLDTEKDPIEIDLKPRLPDRPGSTTEPPVLKGILKVEDDTLTLAFSPPGGDRPTDFESKEGTRKFVSILKRQKDKD
jgi:uncharacterized protein (TIGR03067 family)